MASNEVGVIKYTVTVDSSGLVTGIKSANGEIKDLTSESDRASTSADKLGSIIKKIGVATAIVGATKAVADFGKSAINAYADYEQLYGGTRAIFGEQEEFIEQVSNLAQSAWKDLTISQNDYYNAFNSTYPLIKNDIEDVNDAIKYTNKLMSLESDLANTFGYDMEYAATAINWALKGTYSYLDNLNIGIKGTKEGFLEAAKACGYVVNSVDELTSAQKLDVIQQFADKYGVLGRTAEEAAGTIQGSTKMLKASWDNLILSLSTGENMQEAFEAFETSLTAVLTNIEPVLSAIEENIPFFVEKLSEILPRIFEMLKPVIITIIDALGKLLVSLIDTLAPVLAPVVIKLTMAIVAEILKIIYNAFNEFIVWWGDFWGNLGEKFGNWLRDTNTKIATIVYTAFTNIINGIARLWENLKSKISNIGMSIANAITGAVKGAINKVFGFVEGTVNGFIRAINNAISVINAIPGVSISTLSELHIPRLASGGIVDSSNGGSVIMAGEGGEDEWVVPESKMASLIEKINSRNDNTQPVTINVYGTFATSDDEQRKVAEQIYGKLQELNKSRLGAYL